MEWFFTVILESNASNLLIMLRILHRLSKWLSRSDRWLYFSEGVAQLLRNIHWVYPKYFLDFSADFGHVLAGNNHIYEASQIDHFNWCQSFQIDIDPLSGFAYCLCNFSDGLVSPSSMCLVVCERLISWKSSHSSVVENSWLVKIGAAIWGLKAVWHICVTTCQSPVMIWQIAVISDEFRIPMIWQKSVTNWGHFRCFVKWVSGFDAITPCGKTRADMCVPGWICI